VRHERTLRCKNRVAGAYNTECGQPLLEERVVDGARCCFAARSQEFFFFGVIDQLRGMLQRPNVVENLWHHLNWPHQRGVLRDIYDGAEWQRWKREQWFTTQFVYQGALALYSIRRVLAFDSIIWRSGSRFLFHSRSCSRPLARSLVAPSLVICHQLDCVFPLTATSRTRTPVPT